MNNELYSVYCHIFPDGKKYVGISKDPQNRWRNGFGYQNKAMCEAIKECGWNNVKHEILYTDLEEEKALEIESNLISKLQLNNPSFGYNKLISKSNKKYSVYCHTTPDGRKYIGYSGDPENRWHNGFGYRFNESFFEAISHYGWENIKHEILYSDLSMAEAKKIEAELIEKYNTSNKDFGFNRMIGNNFSEESKQKLSKSKIGIPSPNKNVRMSEEQKKKVSEGLKRWFKEHPMSTAPLKDSTKEPSYGTTGKVYPTSKPVLRIDVNGLIKRYVSLSDAELDNGISKKGISMCCLGKLKSFKGYIWKYPEIQEVIA